MFVSKLPKLAIEINVESETFVTRGSRCVPLIDTIKENTSTHGTVTDVYF